MERPLVSGPVREAWRNIEDVCAALLELLQTQELVFINIDIVAPERLLQDRDAVGRRETSKPRHLLPELELQHDDLARTREGDVEA